MNIIKKSGIIVLAAALAACQTPGAPQSSGINKEQAGQIVGGVAGAVVGSQIGGGRGRVVTGAVGAIAGSMIGQSIGASLDRADLAYYSRTQQTALETGLPGEVLPWKNPESGNSGTIVAGDYYKTSEGQYCREFNQEVMIGGQKEQAYGRACRQPDGSWKIVE